MKKWIIEKALSVWSKAGFVEKLLLIWIFLPTIHNAQNYFFQKNITEPTVKFNQEKFRKELKHEIIQEAKADRNEWAAPLIQERKEQISTLATNYAVMSADLKNVSEKVNFMYVNGFTFKPRR